MKKDLKIIVCCGSGGVGKTTTAAALGITAALEGKKTIVLTIDPAKRLATAMGLTALTNEPREIPLPQAKGQLFAMMLDTKRTFDRLIERHASNPESGKSILNNRLYQHMSSMIAGSQEYMAMEKLYELHEEDEYDMMILDTPPTRHALDFLEAPQKMIHLTGNSLLQWFLKPGFFAGRLGLGTLEKGVRKILSVFDRLAGFGFLQELAEMILLISNLLGGFHERAEKVYNLLRQKYVGFILVTSPAAASIGDALFFHQKIESEGLPFLGFIINRLHEPAPNPRAKDLETLSPSFTAKIKRHLDNYDQLTLRDKQGVEQLKKRGGKRVFYKTIPLFANDVHDLEGLKKMGKFLKEQE